MTRGAIFTVWPAPTTYAAGALPCLNVPTALPALEEWAALAIASECEWGTLPRAATPKAHRCDGLLVGPFQSAPPFDVLIVNTDGTLAERSGNGLTIFPRR